MLNKQSFSKTIQVSQYQNVSILNFIGAKDDGGGGDNWSCKMCKAPVKLSPPTHQYPQYDATIIRKPSAD